MSAIGKWAVGLLLAVPLAAYVLGSLAAADTVPARRAPLLIEVTETGTPTPLPPPSGGQTRAPDDGRPRGKGDDAPDQGSPSRPAPPPSTPATPRTTIATPGAGTGSPSPTRGPDDGDGHGPPGGDDDHVGLPETVTPSPDDLDDPDDDLGRDDDSSSDAADRGEDDSEADDD